MINTNTIIFIILFVIIIAIISFIYKIHSTKEPPKDIYETLTVDNEKLIIKKDIQPELKEIFKDQRNMKYDLDRVCNLDSCYNVRTDIENVDETVRLLNEIDLMIERLTYCMKTKYCGKPGKPALIDNPYMKMLTDNIIDKYKKENMIENSTNDTTLTSFVTDKGKLFAICTRLSSGTGRHHDLELLKFIALHELSHIANSLPGTENHGDEFWKTFKLIHKEALENGLCTNIRTKSGTITYCNGLVLNDSNFDLSSLKL